MSILLPDEPGLARAYADEQPVRDAYWRPGKGQVVMDIGAAVGSYTMPALAAGARVTAVDPDTDALAKLERVAALNGLTDYTSLACAVFDGGAYPEDMRAALEASGHRYMIPLRDAAYVTLDELAAGLDRLDWIKIDVEGAELGVLAGGIGTLTRLRPRLLIEDHTEVYPFTAAMDSRRRCTDLLTQAGYAVARVPWGPPPRTYLVCEP